MPGETTGGYKPTWDDEKAARTSMTEEQADASHERYSERITRVNNPETAQEMAEVENVAHMEADIIAQVGEHLKNGGNTWDEKCQTIVEVGKNKIKERLQAYYYGADLDEVIDNIRENDLDKEIQSGQNRMFQKADRDNERTEIKEKQEEFTQRVFTQFKEKLGFNEAGEITNTEVLQNIKELRTLGEESQPDSDILKEAAGIYEVRHYLWRILADTIDEERDKTMVKGRDSKLQEPDRFGYLDSEPRRTSDEIFQIRDNMINKVFPESRGNVLVGLIWDKMDIRNDSRDRFRLKEDSELQSKIKDWAEQYKEFENMGFGRTGVLAEIIAHRLEEELLAKTMTSEALNDPERRASVINKMQLEFEGIDKFFERLAENELKALKG